MYSKASLKSEGLNLNIDKEILDDQKTLEVGPDIPKNAKIEKEEKVDFENFKVLYKGAIDEKCAAEYGSCEDTKLWEDTAKEMFLKSTEYVPESDNKTDGDLENKEIKTESKKLNESFEDDVREIAAECEDLEDVVSDMLEYLTKLDDAWTSLPNNTRENLDYLFNSNSTPSYCIRWLFAALEDIKSGFTDKFEESKTVINHKKVVENKECPKQQ